MSLTAIGLFESTANSTLCKNSENVSGGRNVSNSHQLVPTSEMKMFHELHVHHVYSGFRNEANSHHLARIGERKFLMNTTYIVSRKQESKVFGSGGRNESNSHWLVRIGKLNTTQNIESGLRGRNVSNSHQLVPTSEMKMFHELHVHHV